MKIFDSHCHVDDRSFRKDFDDMLTRARAAGVVAMMIAGIDPERVRRAVALAERYPNIYAAVGIHPHDSRHCGLEQLEVLQPLSAHPKVRAWGEIGLDYNRNWSPREDQERCFVTQLDLSGQLGLPVIFHERDTGGRFLELLRPHWPAGRQGVVHCFSGTAAELEHYLDMDLHIGITGIITMQRRGEKLQEMVVKIPAERLLVETDAPYLTPAPHKNRTRRNEPAFVKSVLVKVADLRRQSPEELAAVTWANTCRLFNLSPV